VASIPLNGIGHCKGSKKNPQRLAYSKSIKIRAAPESTNAMTEYNYKEQIKDIVPVYQIKGISKLFKLCLPKVQCFCDSLTSPPSERQFNALLMSVASLLANVCFPDPAPFLLKGPLVYTSDRPLLMHPMILFALAAAAWHWLLQFKSSVGIFSRSSENEYSWLRNLLESQDFGKIKPVYSCCISNNGFSRFCDEQERGRVNVTDVTDSLYDEELEHLSSTLGKENVVVVIDDLDDDGDAVKNTILCSQPKIKNLAQDLILVRSASPEEKKRRAKDGLKTVLH
ncbi:unnamed protein product, partial [Ranitomeya imitator]